MAATRKVVDAADLSARITAFLNAESATISLVGRTINQVFEAFVFAELVSHYKRLGWKVQLKNLQSGEAVLKFSTRGNPNNYTYAEVTKGADAAEVRHQLRVETAHNVAGQVPAASLCLDVAVINGGKISATYEADDFLQSADLITFGEAKHMTAFAELIAGFIGLVHEVAPGRLNGAVKTPNHLSPFLFVSGTIQRAAKGIVGTMATRGFDVEVFHQGRDFAGWHLKQTVLPVRRPRTAGKNFPRAIPTAPTKTK